MFWVYKSNSGTVGLFDKLLCYDYVLQRWAPIAMRGGYLGSLSQPGLIQPGFCFQGYAVWKGPYPVAQMPGYPFGKGNPIDVVSGTFRVTNAVASQMAASDAQWWEFH